MQVSVRPAEAADLPALTELYNHYIVCTSATFDCEPFTVEQRAEWFAQFATAGRYRLLVAIAGDELLGYASSARFRLKAAYDTSVETSVYCRPDRHRRGVGSALYAALFEGLREEDCHRAYAGVTVPNPASIAFHRRFGFERVGLFREVGRKLGRYWDVEWLEKPLPHVPSER